MDPTAFIAAIEKNLPAGVPVTQGVAYLKKQSFACHDETKSARWTTIKPVRTTGCTLILRELATGWEIDIVLPEDEKGNLIKPVINKHKISL